MKECYNRAGFRLFKKIMELVRKLFSADPFVKIKGLGMLGQVVGGIFDRIIDPLIHKLSFRLTGLFFDRKRDKPYKGCAVYTFNNMNLKGYIKITFELLIGLPAFSFIVQFFSADLITQLRMLLSIIPIFLLILGVYRIIKWFKQLL